MQSHARTCMQTVLLNSPLRLMRGRFLCANAIAFCALDQNFQDVYTITHSTIILKLSTLVI